MKSFFIQMKSASLVSSLEKEVVVARRRQNVTSILYSIWRDCKKFILEFRISDSISVLFPALSALRNKRHSKLFFLHRNEKQADQRQNYVYTTRARYCLFVPKALGTFYSCPKVIEKRYQVISVCSKTS